MIAILITIMVLELRTPHRTALAALRPVAAYGAVLLAAWLAYYIPQAALLRTEDDSSVLAGATCPALREMPSARRPGSKSVIHSR